MSERWRQCGRVILAGEGKEQRVIVGETCGAPSNAVAQWIVNRHNYDIMPWYRRLVTKAPKLEKESR